MRGVAGRGDAGIGGGGMWGVWNVYMVCFRYGMFWCGIFGLICMCMRVVPLARYVVVCVVVCLL